MDRLCEAFSVEYMFIVIVASYFVIKLVETINKNKGVPTWLKRLVTFVVGAISFILFEHYTDIEFQVMLSSYLAAVFFYDIAIKKLLQWLGVDYKKQEDADNN